MSLYKRGSTWWIDFTTPGGERVRCATRTDDRTEAQELHDRLRTEAWRVHNLGEKPKRTWDEAAYRWLKETEHKATHLQDVYQVAWLRKFFRGKHLDEITRDMIAGVGEVKRKASSPATANRCLAVIRAILRRAALDWEWIDRAPVIKLYREPKRRVRWITPVQVMTLLAALPEHLADMVKFSLATGLRKRNVVELEWSQVDLGRHVAWIYADQAKGRRDIHVSLNATAREVLTKQVGKHPTSTVLLNVSASASTSCAARAVGQRSGDRARQAEAPRGDRPRHVTLHRPQPPAGGSLWVGQAA